MKPDVSSLPQLASDGSSHLLGRDRPWYSPNSSRASRSCFVTGKGPGPAVPGAGNGGPGLFSRAALQPDPGLNSGLATPVGAPLPARPPPLASLAPHLPDAAVFGHGELLLLFGSFHRDFDDPRLGGGTPGGGPRGAATPGGTLRALRHGGRGRVGRG